MNECALNSSCKNTHTIMAIMKDGRKQIRKRSPNGGLLKETNTTRITPPNLEM